MRQANRSTVSARLPALARDFAARSSHDVEGMLVLLADGAVARDEGREHRGAVAIRLRHQLTLEGGEIAHLEIGS